MFIARVSSGMLIGAMILFGDAAEAKASAGKDKMRGQEGNLRYINDTETRKE